MSADPFADIPMKSDAKLDTKLDTKPSISDPFADIPVEPTTSQKAGSFARGLGKGIVGGFGDIQEMGSDVSNYLAKKTMPTGMYETYKKIPNVTELMYGRLPRSEDVERGLQTVEKTVGIKPGIVPGTKGYEFAGEIAPAVVGGVKGVTSLYKYGASKLRSPPPLAEVKDLADVGESGFNLLQKTASKLFEARSAEAKEKYNTAFTAARNAQAKQNPFATSGQGRTLLSQLENDKRIIAGGESFEKGAEKIAGIDRLIKAIQGTTTGGFTRTAKETPTGRNIYSITGTPKKTSEKDIEALVEELRFLRDVDAKGKPYEAYSALSADYKRDLIKKMESQLYDWSDEYRIADEAYKLASEKLNPYKTQLMSNALKGEKFDPRDLIKSPEKFGEIFFSDVNAVKNLKEATQRPSEVARLGKEYVASILANKTPTQVQAFVKDTNNTGWLKEAGIYNDVVQYANKTTGAETKQKILKNLGTGAAVGIGITAIGGPVYYGLKRSLGL
jgi:hypothetical protein